MSEDTSITALQARYPLVTLQRTFAGSSFSLTCVRDQDALLSGVTDEAVVDRFPFGLLLWASAIGLSEYLAEHSESIQGKRVLEIGAGGVGLPGLVAAHLGAAQVIQTDYHEETLQLLAYNAQQNALSETITQHQADWRDFPRLSQPFDVVLGSDILYERTLHDSLHALLPTLVVPGGLLLIADPIRPQALTFIERLEKEGAKDWKMPIHMLGRRVQGVKETREIALFALTKK